MTHEAGQPRLLTRIRYGAREVRTRTFHESGVWCGPYPDLVNGDLSHLN
jgi:hypothetical protein